jgi:hypothetical protein
MGGFSWWSLSIFGIGIVLIGADFVIPVKTKKKIGWVLILCGIPCLLVGIIGLCRDGYVKWVKPNPVYTVPIPATGLQSQVTPQSSGQIHRTKSEKHQVHKSSSPQLTEAAPPQPQPQVQINSAPNGIAIGGGTVANPTVNNFGLPPARLTYTEQILTPLPANGEGFKVLQVFIKTDRSIPGAMVGIVFSGPIEPITADKDQPQLIGAGIVQMNWGNLQRDNEVIPNGLGIVINAPSVFMPGQILVVTVKSKMDVRVVGVAPVH